MTNGRNAKTSKEVGKGRSERIKWSVVRKEERKNLRIELFPN